MERLKELMTLLKEQLERKADPSQMLQTAQLLEAELRLLASQPAPARVVPTKIAVMMPSSAKIVADPLPVLEVQSIPIASVTASSTAISASASASASAPMPVAINGSTASPIVNGVPAGSINGAAVASPAATISPAVASPAPPARSKEPERGTWPFDPLAEKPTDRFTLSQKTREINDVIGNGNGASSLNEKLKSDVVELKSALNDTPVRDLKKAIGVNDRYVFISQLFRGDEVMYERSLKTINGFRILPEAEYWMERELKVKLGWDENREATRHFYQLVKRRFS
jgi:hypothetical protein